MIGLKISILLILARWSAQNSPALILWHSRASEAGCTMWINYLGIQLSLLSGKNPGNVTGKSSILLPEVDGLTECGPDHDP